VLVCVVVGVAGYLLVVEPFLLRGWTVGWIAGTLALAFAIRAVLKSAFPREAYVVPDPIPFRKLGEGGFVQVGGASVQVRALFVIAVAIGLALGSVWLLRRTRLGWGLRAIVEDVEGARLVGVPVDFLVPIAFGLVGGLAALAAIVASPSAPVTLDTWPLVGVKALAAAVVVRFALPWPAFGAGLALGLGEAALAELSLGAFRLEPGWAAVAPLVLVVVVLAVRPPAEALDERE
jgi:branched-chain amino acid transport system permease protein